MNLRETKGTPLTHVERDQNFKDLEGGHYLFNGATISIPHDFTENKYLNVQMLLSPKLDDPEANLFNDFTTPIALSVPIPSDFQDNWTVNFVQASTFAYTDYEGSSNVYEADVRIRIDVTRTGDTLGFDFDIVAMAYAAGYFNGPWFSVAAPAEVIIKSQKTIQNLLFADFHNVDSNVSN
jgi:hypothetical protein